MCLIILQEDDKNKYFSNKNLQSSGGTIEVKVMLVRDRVNQLTVPV